VDESEDERIKGIILKMEEYGMSFGSFFEELNMKSSNDGMIALGKVTQLMTSFYPDMKQEDKLYLMGKLNVTLGKVEVLDLQTLLTKYSRNLKPSVAQTFNIIAARIKKSGQDSTNFFSDKCNWQSSDEVDWSEFERSMKRIFQLPSNDLDDVFASLNLDKDEFILVEDLLVTLESYGNDPNMIGNSNIHKHISSYPDLSPRSRYENIISLLNKSLKQQNMAPMNVYKMAD
jgi:hypothetical protein